MAKLLCEPFVLDPRPAYPLRITAKRYTLEGIVSRGDVQSAQPGLTLILLHATGSHKEVWEVTVQYLLQKANQENLKIDDVFSIESPSHGESAVLNEKELHDLFSDRWPPREYAKAAHIFLTAGTDKGARVDFSRRRLVGIGHSVGASAMFLMKELSPTVNFEFFIAIEPGISLKGNHHTNIASQALTAWTWLRPDVWTSRKSARKALESSMVHSMWDPRVLDLFVEYGLRTHPAAKYDPPFSFNGVTTASTKALEAASFRSDELVVDSLQAYTETTRERAVHIIWGTINDVKSPETRDLLSDESSGRSPASVRFVEDAGHLASCIIDYDNDSHQVPSAQSQVVQQKPEAVADIILDIIQNKPILKL
ncbi:hypothetical protein E1B28_006324 [Marasmius oreades]|uniref:AB hydrolase-1 domain-containing protein n=1 Tax=Marasmius oreades TaxID=181124 RepID=A0A9P7S539_9AGAR|nr:uncharacterized protein E1B28_006324 [Marasmius oreades]KAG7095594.1 hypothetical protein E1B28_006324 [Marasmius oreades]